MRRQATPQTERKGPPLGGSAKLSCPEGREVGVRAKAPVQLICITRLEMRVGWQKASGMYGLVAALLPGLHLVGRQADIAAA